MSYSINGSYLSSPDTPSTIYPDRLIRPLPSRSLRSRITPDVAEKIDFPPTVPSTSLPIYGQYGENGEYMNDSKVLVQQNGDLYDHDHIHDFDDDHDEEHCPHHHHRCPHHDDDDLDSSEDISPAVIRRTNGYRSSPRSPRAARSTHYGAASRSSPSGLDGYDAFENTNNKKKRKIPTSGSLSLHHSTLSADLAHMGISSTQDGASDAGPYYATGGPAGLGLQGAGRGRNSRRLSNRNPLDDEPRSDQGIISAAIANATALLRKPLGKGQENTGVLDQASQTPTNSQFTFTCESDSKATFPEQSLYSPGYHQRAHHMPAPAHPPARVATHGTQTGAVATGRDPSQQHATQAGAEGKKHRRRRGDVLALAARQRRLQQEYANLHHPPLSDEIWICEFCEYESIFGMPPTALIRSYEIRDRKERKRLAEKRRLLEKAKLKGRKSKKQSKNAAKAAGNATQQSLNNQAYDPPLDQLGEYDLDDGYDDDPIPIPAPQAPHKQPSVPSAYHTAGTKIAAGGVDRGGTH